MKGWMLSDVDYYSNNICLQNPQNLVSMLGGKVAPQNVYVGVFQVYIGKPYGKTGVGEERLCSRIVKYFSEKIRKSPHLHSCIIMALSERIWKVCRNKWKTSRILKKTRQLKNCRKKVWCVCGGKEMGPAKTCLVVRHGKMEGGAVWQRLTRNTKAELTLPTKTEHIILCRKAKKW